MKFKLLVFLLFAFSVNASSFAQIDKNQRDHLGEWALFKAVSKDNGEIFYVTYSISDYLEDKNIYLLKKTIATEMGEDGDDIFQEIKPKAIWTHKNAKTILKTCHKIGGKIKKIAHKQGSIKSCKITTPFFTKVQASTTYYADIPVVGYAYLETELSKITLIDYHWAD